MRCHLTPAPRELLATFPMGAKLVKIAIVDAYSTGRTLATALQQRGVCLVHVQCASVVPDSLTRGFESSDFARNLTATEDAAALADKLTHLGVQRVLAGSESGVILTDTLNHLMGLPGNDYATAASRRNKALMAKTVSEAGLPVPNGRTFNDRSSAVAWYRKAAPEQVVVKPLTSAGTDNVHFCQSAREVDEACRAVLAAKTLYGEQNQSVLVQEQLNGVEYYINTVSDSGLHRVAEIWRYTKLRGPGGTPIYDYEEPVEAGSDEATPLRLLVPRVLKALGVVSGAAHTEVMMTARGAVLIESGARLGGATVPWVVEKYSGLSQTSLLVDSVVDPKYLVDFDETAVTWSGKVRNVAFVNRVSGRASAADWIGRIAVLPTVVEAVSSLSSGATLRPTADLLSSPGFALLAADDPKAVERDYRAIRAMEEVALYTA